MKNYSYISKVIEKPLKQRDMARKYENGYLPKIEYWQSKYESAKSNGTQAEVVRALEKLTYFVKRQNEVYGWSKAEWAELGHS